MAKSTTSSNDALDAFLRAVDPTWRSGSSRYITLHTATPGVGGTQTTNEATYTSYARVTVTASSGFTAASSASSSNTGTISFPQCTGGTNTITYVSIGTASTGAGQVIYFGALTSSLAVANLILPLFSIGALVASEA